MLLLLLSLGTLFVGGGLALATSGSPRRSLALGTGSAVLGSALGLAAALQSLLAGPPAVLALPWSAPLAAIRLGIDPLAAVFLAALFAVSIPAALAGHGSLARPHPGEPRRLGPFLLFFNLLIAAIALVLVARQAVLLLVAWEVMAVTSFLLVTFEEEDAGVRKAGLTYLVASHLASAFLLVLVLLLGREAGGLDFETLVLLRDRADLSTWLFLALGLVGFGTKAGLVPLHVWLPEAHPAAPSHVSAVLSGAMINVGIYGLLRLLSFLPPAPFAFGALLAALGAAGGLGAVLLALGQTDLKRALAYSSVENMGLVLLAVGLGTAAAAEGAPLGAALAFAAALLHVWNHALMKALAFLGAGALVHAAGTRDVERMGGLLRRLPRSAPWFLMGLAALAALPPLNGFVSEWLLTMGLLEATRAPLVATPLAATLAVAAVTTIAGVAAVAFTRLAGVALLGSPRSPGAAAAAEEGPRAWVPLAMLGAGCLGLALFPAEALALLAPAVAGAARLPVGRVVAELAGPARSLAVPLRVGLLALGIATALAYLLRSRLLARRPVGTSDTWGCGFTRPSARMQVTGSSYAQLLLSSTPGPLAPRVRLVLPRGTFPERASLVTDHEDPARRGIFEPAFRALGERFQALRGLQAGKLHLQLLYTVATLVVLTLYFVLRRP